jgi:hypothetical protein
MCEPLSTRECLCWPLLLLLLLLLPGWRAVVGASAQHSTRTPLVRQAGSRSRLLLCICWGNNSTLTEQPCQVFDRIPVGFFLH